MQERWFNDWFWKEFVIRFQCLKRDNFLVCEQIKAKRLLEKKLKYKEQAREKASTICCLRFCRERWKNKWGVSWRQNGGKRHRLFVLPLDVVLFVSTVTTFSKTRWQTLTALFLYVFPSASFTWPRSVLQTSLLQLFSPQANIRQYKVLLVGDGGVGMESNPILSFVRTWKGGISFLLFYKLTQSFCRQNYFCKTT